LKLRTDLGLGKGYGETNQLPFFKNYYGGGFGSVRGFERNSLGPQEGFNSSQLSSRSGSLGGNVQIEFGAEIIFPMPFVKDKRSMQSAFFIDAGNIFNTRCDLLPVDVKNCFKPSLGELRYSIGVGVTWLSAMGPLTFSFAKPFNTNVVDELEMFQFSLGNQF
jgi:outer membrane protein insertion porin family